MIRMRNDRIERKEREPALPIFISVLVPYRPYKSSSSRSAATVSPVKYGTYHKRSHLQEHNPRVDLSNGYDIHHCKLRTGANGSDCHPFRT